MSGLKTINGPDGLLFVKSTPDFAYIYPQESHFVGSCSRPSVWAAVTTWFFSALNPSSDSWIDRKNAMQRTLRKKRACPACLKILPGISKHLDRAGNMEASKSTRAVTNVHTLFEIYSSSSTLQQSTQLGVVARDGSFCFVNNSQAGAKPMLHMGSLQLLCQIGGSEFLSGFKGVNWIRGCQH